MAQQSLFQPTVAAFSREAALREQVRLLRSGGPLLERDALQRRLTFAEQRAKGLMETLTELVAPAAPNECICMKRH